MLTDLRLNIAIPIADLSRARGFYTEKLGLTSIGEGGGGWLLESGSTRFVLVQSNSAGAGQYSLVTWITKDIAADVHSLQDQGVLFEHYDMPGMKFEGDIAILGADKVAWFKDSEGNILALAQHG